MVTTTHAELWTQEPNAVCRSEQIHTVYARINERSTVREADTRLMRIVR